MKHGKFKKNDARYIPFVILKKWSANELIRKCFPKKNNFKERLLKDDEQ